MLVYYLTAGLLVGLGFFVFKAFIGPLAALAASVAVFILAAFFPLALVNLGIFGTLFFYGITVPLIGGGVYFLHQRGVASELAPQAAQQVIGENEPATQTSEGEHACLPARQADLPLLREVEERTPLVERSTPAKELAPLPPALEVASIAAEPEQPAIEPPKELETDHSPAPESMPPPGPELEPAPDKSETYKDDKPVATVVMTSMEQPVDMPPADAPPTDASIDEEPTEETPVEETKTATTTAAIITETLEHKPGDDHREMKTAAELAATQPTAPEPAASEQEESSPTVTELVSRALRLAKQRNHAAAVRLLQDALKQDPSPYLTGLIVSELSSIYQHLGQYWMAQMLLRVFLARPGVEQHMLTPVLREKLTFCEHLTRLLYKHNLGQPPYDHVPEELKREAFSRTRESYMP